MRYAQLDGDTATNVIVWDGEAELEGACDLVECDEQVSVGWRYVDGVWVPPAEPVEAAVEPEPDAEELARRELHAQARDKLADAVGLTDEEALALFDGADDIPASPAE